MFKILNYFSPSYLYTFFKLQIKIPIHRQEVSEPALI